MIKQSSYFLLFMLVIFQSNILVSNFITVYAQNLKGNGNNTNSNIYSMVSNPSDLNITMQFEPKNPTTDKQTKILFQINHLNGTYYNNLIAVITILDSEGGLYKFNKQEVNDGKVFADYIFPVNVNSKIVIQLYKNNQGYALSSFDIKPLNPSSPPYPPSNNFFNFFSDLSKSISSFFKNIFK